MDKEEFAKLLMATFLEELQEHVVALNRDLLQLEKDPVGDDRETLLRELFRAAHSVKGAARAVNVELIETACHHLEDILTALRDGQLPAAPGLFGVLFKAADAIEEAGMRLREEQSLDESPLAAIIGELAAATSQVASTDCGHAAADDPYDNPRNDTHDDQPTRTPVANGPAAERPAPAGPHPTTETSPTTDSAASAGDQPERPAAPARTAVAASASDTPTARSPTAPATLRIAAEKLDSLLARSGELLVARRRVESRSDEVDELRDLVSAWRSQWRLVEKPLRRLLASEEDLGIQRQHAAPPLPRRARGVLTSTAEQLAAWEKRLDQLTALMRGDQRLLAQTCTALEDEVHQVRMLPFAEACRGLHRTVRDIAQATGKEVDLVLIGEDVEMDRSVLEGLKDPLLHLVRNAVDHGLELPDQRVAAGKPRTGTIRVAAAMRAEEVEVTVTDDGRGFDLDRIRDKLRAKGWPEPADDRQLARVVFEPGFSTAPIITDVSGRGVGLDVVRSRIEAFHGSVDIEFPSAGGTRFTLVMPLTLTTIRTVRIRLGNAFFAIPTTSVVQLIRFKPDTVGSIGGRPVLAHHGEPLPLAHMTRVLGAAGDQDEDSTHALGILLAAGERRVIFVVDEVVAEEEVVVTNLGERIRRLPHVSGATLLPSGQVALVVNVANLIQSALKDNVTVVLPVERQPARGAARQLLVVDDSITTRTLLKSILETAGYVVRVAADGMDAWRLLKSDPVDLVVSDVDMPRMDGFELTKRIRGDRRLEQLPVVLVTARGNEADKRHGVEVGADAYIVKAAFDQGSLLESITQLL